MKLISIRPLAIGAVLLALGTSAPVRAMDTEEFEEQVSQLMKSSDRAAALRRLDALAVEALQAGRPDLRVRASAAHASLRLQEGDSDEVRPDLEEAHAEAQSGGWAAAEAWVNDVFADYWLAQGDSATAAEWMEATWSAALAADPPETDLATRSLRKLETLRESLGHGHLASQARAWRLMLTGTPDAPEPEIVLQPIATTTEVASDEVGRARIFLANATPAPITGTLVLDGDDLAIHQWNRRGEEERITLQFPSATGAVPQPTAQGRKLTLMPGESRTIALEVEPDTPPRPGTRSVSVTWQSGGTNLTSTARFQFRKARDLPENSVANACHVRLSPFVSVPVHMEIYHRGRPLQRVQDILPVTSQPCRIELRERLADGSRGRQWLAIDADGDGSYLGDADSVVSDADGSGYPDVEFGSDKEVAALEIELYPLPAEETPQPATIELMVSLRDGDHWREPADVRHQIEPQP